MKILMLNTMPLYPANNGAKLRVYNLLKQISKRHDVTCIAMHTEHDKPSPAELQAARAFVSEVRMVQRPVSTVFRGANALKSLLMGKPFTCLNFNFPAFAKAIEEALDETDFDLIHCHQLHTLQYVDLFLDKPVLLESQGIAAQQWRGYGLGEGRNPLLKHLCLHQARQLDQSEKNLDALCDAIISCSPRDQEFLEGLCPEVPNVCIPNGVDTSYFTPQATEEEPHSLVYTSAFDYVPNADAVVHFVNDVFPRVVERCPDAHLYLVGKDPVPVVQALASHNVTVTGTVDDVRPYAAKAQVFVVPLRIGQGTRLKVVEAMAMEKAIVSTTVGAEGISHTDGANLVIADEADAMTEAICRLFENPEERLRLGKAARKLAVERYDWALWGDALEDAYDKALGHFRQRRTEVNHDAA